MTCDTVSWVAGRSLSLGRLGTAGHWTRTFEYRCDIAVVRTSFWREVVVEESEIAGKHNKHARVSTEYVSKHCKRPCNLTYRIRTNSMKPKLSNQCDLQSECDPFV